MRAAKSRTCGLIFWATFLLFLAVRVFVLVRFEGYFAFDENYHLATVNPDFAMDYHRADYINALTAWVTRLFGHNYYAVKAIPLLLGCSSFACVMSLGRRWIGHPLAYLGLGLALAGNAYLVYNHTYIRMYIFMEALVSLCLLLLYPALRGKNRFARAALCLLLCLNYCLYTDDASKAMVALFAAALVAFILLGDWFVAQWRAHRWPRVLVWTLISLATLLEAALALFKSGLLFSDIFLKGLRAINDLPPLLSQLCYYLLQFYRTDSPVFLQYLLLRNAPALAGLFYLLLARKTSPALRRAAILIALPLLGYACLFYDAYMVRTFVPFLPGMYLAAFAGLDRLRLVTPRPAWRKGLAGLALPVAAALILCNTPAAFYRLPRIPDETYLANYRAANRYALERQAAGEKIATLYVCDILRAYDGLAPDLILDRNLYNPNTEKADVGAALRRLARGAEPYLVVTDRSYTDYLTDEERALLGEPVWSYRERKGGAPLPGGISGNFDAFRVGGT